MVFVFHPTLLFIIKIVYGVLFSCFSKTFYILALSFRFMYLFCLPLPKNFVLPNSVTATGTFKPKSTPIVYSILVLLQEHLH